MLRFNRLPADFIIAGLGTLSRHIADHASTEPKLVWREVWGRLNSGKESCYVLTSHTQWYTEVTPFGWEKKVVRDLAQAQREDEINVDFWAVNNAKLEEFFALVENNPTYSRSLEYAFEYIQLAKALNRNEVLFMQISGEDASSNNFFPIDGETSFNDTVISLDPANITYFAVDLVVAIGDLVKN